MKELNNQERLQEKQSIEAVVTKEKEVEFKYDGSLKTKRGHNLWEINTKTLINFREIFFESPFLGRTSRHVSNVAKNSAAKRLNMFLMWMVRQDNRGVHFGIWKKINPSALFLPLDVHTGNVGRKLGLLKRNQNDWKAVVEITNSLRKFDPEDPVKYDFALFGLGVFEKF